MKYIIKKSNINDIALNQTDAMNRCINLGEKFIVHFQKIYKNPSDNSVNHWVREMQGWLNQINKIILKHNNKPIPENKLRDWFFTAGSNPDYIVKMDYEELQYYNQFINKCITSHSVKNGLKGVIK